MSAPSVLPSVPADRPARSAVKPASAVTLSPPYSRALVKVVPTSDVTKVVCIDLLWILLWK
jgi:hypothetical protein